MVADTVAAYGRLDAAVNNAALTPDDRLVSDFDEDYWDRPHGRRSQGDRTLHEVRASPDDCSGRWWLDHQHLVRRWLPAAAEQLAYVAAKHGVVGMTKVAAMENGDKNIRVNSVAPEQSTRRCCEPRSSSSG